MRISSKEYKKGDTPLMGSIPTRNGFNLS